MRQTFVSLFVVFVVAFGAWFSERASTLHAEGISADQTSQREQQLQAELKQVENEIAVQKTYLNAKQQETATIQRDIDILDAKINEASLQIRASQLRINQLASTIGEKTNAIGDLEVKIADHRQELSELVQDLNTYGDYTMVEVMLAKENLAEFFEQYDNLIAFRSSMQENLKAYQQAKVDLEVEKSKLAESQRGEEVENIKLSQERQTVQYHQDEKERLKAVSVSEENSYKSVIAAKEARKKEILNQLFTLRDATNINFGQAYELAKEASRITGVRPAFLLGIIEQESALGQNVGRCNLPGQSADKLWYSIMPGPNSGSSRDDQSVYLTIVDKLGISPEAKPLSCPIGNGWGGAMGPAQFIPTTWQAYMGRIANVTGRPSNPWNPEDAFIASSLFLADLGAGRGTTAAEQEAAGRYYAGGNWATAGMGYANSVLNRAANFELLIATLNS